MVGGGMVGGGVVEHGVRRLVLLSLLSLVGCDEGVSRADARFSTPEHTVETLLGAYGLGDVPQETVQARMAEGGGFALQDREAWRACFTDIDQPGGEGMAGYVLGMLAAAKDDLRYELAGDWAYVYPRDEVRVVMAHEPDGYRIVLARSVPDEVRRTLLQVEENAQRRLPSGGAP